MNNYCVYVYIDPRNFKGFYNGKGVGSHKEPCRNWGDFSLATLEARGAAERCFLPSISAVSPSLRCQTAPR
jgi:hypothetical protein